MPRTLGPLYVATVTPHRLSIDKNGVHNTVTSDRTSTAPNRSQGISTTQHKTAGAASRRIHKKLTRVNPNHSESMPLTAWYDTKEMDRIHVSTSDGTHNIFRVIPMNLQMAYRSISYIDTGRGNWGATSREGSDPM